MSNFKLFFAIAILSVLASCGGGGGSGSSTAPTLQPLALNAANAESVSIAVLDAGAAASSSTFGSNIILAASVSSSVETPGFELADFIGQFLQAMPLDAFPVSNLIVGVAFGPETLDCTELGGLSGNVVLSGNVASPNDLSQGDRINASFNNCDLFGLIIDGQMNMHITELSGDYSSLISPSSLGMTIDFNNLTITFELETFFADGDMEFTGSFDEDGIQTFTISGNRLVVSPEPSMQQILYNYSSIDIIDNDTLDVLASTLSGTLDSTPLGGSVAFETPIPFAANIIDIFPSSGILLIRGANNSSIRLVVLGADNISIEIDADGDQTYEDTIDTTWLDLYTVNT